MVKNRDEIYRTKQDSADKFMFDKKVASVFADMISRSVPGYAQILRLIPTLTKQFHLEPFRYYDLGCSLGAGMFAMADGLKEFDHLDQLNIIGIDSSPAMMLEAQSLFTQAPYNDINFEFQCADITTVKLSDAAMVLMNFTLQFIALDKRDELVHTIFDNLIDGGGLIISEKIKFADDATNQTLIDIHQQYKAEQGYSQLEISQKRDAIENVLIPETLEVHSKRLHSAGFKIVTPWLQNLQFISILAIK
ncbi:carboxy-S-adenosyl-L-methionine synthase CmoA [Arenicella sp.]|nr:carboxy-S-adenosyl-L-methionine synthase CmoA [Arenicella sp.]